MDEQACLKCGSSNRTGAKFCAKCGEVLQPLAPVSQSNPLAGDSPPASTPIPISQPVSQSVSPKINDRPALPKSRPVSAPASKPIEPVRAGGSSLSGFMTRLDKEIVTPIASAINQALSSEKSQPSEKPASAGQPKPVNPRSPGDSIGYFRILETITNPHYPYVVYYRARSTICGKCKGTFSMRDSHDCPVCGEPFTEYLIRHSSPSYLPSDEPGRKWLLELSKASIRGFLPYQYLFDQNDQQFLVMELLSAGWQPLAWLAVPQPEDLAIEMITKLGKIVQSIHGQKLALFGDESADPRYSILVTHTQNIFITDLTGCLQTRYPSRLELLQQKDIRILARLLYYLTTGHELRSSIKDAPAGLQKAIEQARANRYPHVQAFLDDLHPTPVSQNLGRGLRQSAGFATHVGMVRDHNEDFIGTYSFAVEQKPGEAQTGLYIVADGMGGHEAGERASKLVTQTIMDKIHQLQAVPSLKGSTRFLGQAMSASEILVNAVKQANSLLVQTRKSAATGNDRGTTLTAALITGSSAIVVNVGDSRTYVFRNGQLQQITKDHSLVASLVSAGLITPEEARSHPQRNQVYRTLGDKEDLEVDTFPQVLSAGDLLLLCSDGLWEMVRDETIQSILEKATSPQAACDTLIQAALQAGGEDNISAIVVRIE